MMRFELASASSNRRSTTTTETEYVVGLTLQATGILVAKRKSFTNKARLVRTRHFDFDLSGSPAGS